MAVHESTTRAAGHALVSRQERRVLVGHRVADGVGDVHRRRAGVDRRLHHLAGEVDVGARRVLGLNSTSSQERAWRRRRAPGPARPRAWSAACARCGWPRWRGTCGCAGAPRRAPPRRALDVGGVGARQAGDDRAVHLAGDRADRLEVARRGDREAGLDHVDAEPRELLGDLQLLGRVQRDARRLLAVAQGRVEDDDPVGVTAQLLSKSFLLLLRSEFAASGRPRLFPPRGEEKKERERPRSDMPFEEYLTRSRRARCRPRSTRCSADCRAPGSPGRGSGGRSGRCP